MFLLVLRTLVVYVLIVAAMRLMGKKQLGELQPSELVSTILISNLASLSIESPDVPLVTSMLTVFLIVACEILVSALCVRFRRVHFKTSKEALESGVAMVHQELNQALKRNVMDNMWLGRYPLVGPFTSEKKMYADTQKLFEKLGVSVNPRAVMSTLPVSQRQMVEIAKAVSYNAKVIVFDEPTSSLTEEEVAHLFRIINMLRDQGCGIIYISHKMEEILRISDEVTVMRDGAWVATEPRPCAGLCGGVHCLLHCLRGGLCAAAAGGAARALSAVFDVQL